MLSDTLLSGLQPASRTSGSGKRLRESGLKVHPVNCAFGAKSIDLLGHCVSLVGLQPQQDKLAVVRNLPFPVRDQPFDVILTE